jgi:hypothetical protein
VVAAILVAAGLPSLAEEPARLAEQLAAIRTWRESLGPQVFDPEEIDALKREGRR